MEGVGAQVEVDTATALVEVHLRPVQPREQHQLVLHVGHEPERESAAEVVGHVQALDEVPLDLALGRGAHPFHLAPRPRHRKLWLRREMAQHCAARGIFNAFLTDFVGLRLRCIEHQIRALRGAGMVQHEVQENVAHQAEDHEVVRPRRRCSKTCRLPIV